MANTETRKVPVVASGTSSRRILAVFIPEPPARGTKVRPAWTDVLAATEKEAAPVSRGDARDSGPHHQRAQEP